MGRSAIVTGTRKGIGKAIAEHLLSQGWSVAGCSRKPAEIKHPAYKHYELDVADEEKVVAMVREVGRERGLDALINNAGIASMNHVLLSTSRTARQVFDTNFLGTFLFLREAAKIMGRAKRGRIVNFSTVAVPLTLEGEALYAASKSAVETLTRVASAELGALGVTVNAVGPTPVETDLIALVPPEKIQALLQRQAIKRFGRMEDVLNVIDFFLRDESEFVTGQCIYLGGIHA